MAKHGDISSHSPHFFRIILPPILRNGTLELPRTFVKEHGKQLSKYARLKLPTGAQSKLEVKMCNDRAWLHEGWPDFVRKYSIQCGYFLLFRYKGGSRFNVLIFDLSTSEIEYPKTTCNKMAAKSKPIQKINEEDSIKAFDDSPRRLKKRDDQASEKLLKGTKETPNHMQMRKRKRTDSGKGSTAQQRANKALKCKEPGFTVLMRSSFVRDWYRMDVPTSHASRYLADQHGKQAFLHGVDGETWAVNCYVHSSKARFSSGWKDFAVDNHLQEGDTCLFHLFQQVPIHYKVTIFRRAESPA